jgi:hypothetical protein
MVGDWKGAASHYKNAIVEELESDLGLPLIVEELRELYRANEVEADFGRILECPRIVKEIHAANVGQDEEIRLTKKMYAEISQLLENLP